MKTLVTRRPLAFLAASLSVALGLTLGISLSSGAGDAPRKGAEHLARWGAPVPAREATSVRPASASHANCGGCTTMTAVRASDSAKGGEVLLAQGKPAKLVSRHGCDGCSTSVGVKGIGKSKVQTVAHGCTKQPATAVNCCR